jgi:hypothetical protein
MDQEKAVKGLMIDFRSVNPYLHTSVYPEVERVLQLMWQVSWEMRGKELGAHHLKPVQQLDRDDNVLETYSSLKEAALVVGYQYNPLETALRRGSLTHRGRFRWKYVNLVE